jgi:glycosyltransferase involved in cell wall biosynthesis
MTSYTDLLRSWSEMKSPLNNKVLVMFPFDRSPSAGGPEGFIAQNLSGWETDYLSTTPPILCRKPPSVRERLESLWRSPLKQWLSAGTSSGVNRVRMYDHSGAKGHRVIWFHDAGVYNIFSDLLSKEHVLVYQPHCPQLPWEEFNDAAQAEYKKIVVSLIERAAMIVLPNPYCLEVYRQVLANKPITFIASGCAQPSNVQKKSLDRSLVHFLFIGRRSPIKGFDLVVSAFKQAWVYRKDIRLVICGSGDPEVHPGIIDVGQTDRIHDWIASVDLVVNANRKSYFDLSVMETLSIGTMIAVTPTQGHKMFLEGGSRGVISIEPNVDAFRELFLAYAPSPEMVRIGNAENKSLYLEQYSTQKYRHRLAAALPSVLSEI